MCRLRYFAIVSSTAKHMTAPHMSAMPVILCMRSCAAWSCMGGGSGGPRVGWRTISKRGEETMRAFGRMVLIAATLMPPAGMAQAADIHVLSVGAVQNAVRELAAEFQKDNGGQVVLTSGPPVVAMAKIKAGEIFDAVIVSDPAMDGLDRDGIVNPESRQRLGRTGLGIAVRADAPAPDLSSPEAFKEALPAARSIAYGDPTLPNQSGEKAQKALAAAGLLDTLKEKLRIVAGQATSQEQIAKGAVE